MRHDERKIQRLRSVPVFSGCGARELRRVAVLADEIFRPAGAVLVTEGQVGKEIMILADGRAGVIRGHVRVATLVAGALIGEIATLDGARRTATVVADTDVALFVLDRRGFDRLILDVPFVARRMMIEMARRLRTLTEAVPR